jgi:protein TonB
MLNNSNLYGSEWLALVFSNRNQNYGAFVLRSQSSSILLKSLAIVAPLFIMLFVGPMIYGQLHKEEVIAAQQVLDIKIADPIHSIEKEEPKQEVKKQEPIKSSPPAKQQPVESTQFTSNIKLVENPPIEPPTAIELQNTVIASTTQTGAQGTTNAPVGNVGTEGIGVGEGTGSGTDEIKEVGGVDLYPEFPGGMSAWSKFIEKNLRYPYAAQDAGIQGKVFVSFVVEKDGSISDVKVSKGIGYGCDDEAVRVIKKSPRWKPGVQNKKFVRVRYHMPISYLLNQ